jgi:hypothetical protein
MYIYPGSYAPYTLSVFATEEGKFSALLEQSASQLERIVDRAKTGQLPAFQLSIPYTGRTRKPRPIDALKSFVAGLEAGRGDRNLRALLFGELLK